MRVRDQGIFISPSDGQPLSLVVADESDGTDIEGWLVDSSGGQRYPVVRGIPRFVGERNYADNFGFQWKRFRRTQLDSHSRTSISSDRFWEATRWSPEMLKGRRILDLGCGAGRFAEVALSAGAEVFAVDLSEAVDACYANLGANSRLTVLQASVYELPFPRESFDFVYSLGVIQHTPDPIGSIVALSQMVRPGGRICVDVYWRRWQSLFHPRYALRPFTKRMQGDKLFEVVRKTAPRLMNANRVLRRVPVVGSPLTRLVPVADYTGRLPLSEAQLQEWAVLDTYDWLGPSYDQPMTREDLEGALAKCGFRRIQIHHTGHLAATAVKVEGLDT